MPRRTDTFTEGSNQLFHQDCGQHGQVQPQHGDPTKKAKYENTMHIDEAAAVQEQCDDTTAIQLFGQNDKEG